MKITMRATRPLAVGMFLLLSTGGCESETPTAAGAGLVPESPSAGKGVRGGVHFKARVQGVSSVPQDPSRCEPLLTIGLQSAGTGTHLGRFTGTHSHCLDPATGRFTDGLVTFTAANGDRLSGTYGPGALIPTDQPGVFTLENPIVFTGGTGRFTGTTGQAQATGTVDLTASEVTFSLLIEGTLVR